MLLEFALLLFLNILGYSTPDFDSGFNSDIFERAGKYANICN